MTLMEQLTTIFRTSGKTLAAVMEETQLSRSAVRGVLCGENANPNLLTVLDIAKCLDAEIVIQTAESKAAIDQSDITAYREMISARDHTIDDLVKINAAQQGTIESQRATIEHQRGTIDNQSGQISRLLDSIDRKDAALADLSRR